MAVENQFKHSKDLFKCGDGSTMVFFMRPCSHRQELRPLIESGGGKVTSKVMKESIKLAEKGSTVSADDYISAKYIEDCVNQNKLLPMDSYRVKSGSRVRNESGDTNVSNESFGSNDSLSPASYIVQTKARDYKGRSKYTKEDDIAMLTFLLDEKRYSEALGIRVWKDMESKKVTLHTASSMNTRYRKHILPNIEKYRYDLDRQSLAKLTGAVVTKETEPEFSAEALFTTSKRSCRSETTVRKVDLTGEFGDEFDFTTGDESSQDVEIVPVNADGSKKKINVDKQCDVGNKHMNKDDERDNENVDNNEYDCSEEHKEKRIEKRNDEPRRSVRKSPRTKKHSQDLTVDDDSEGRNIGDSRKSSVLENDSEELNKEDIFYAKALDLHIDKVTGDDVSSETCNGNLESSNDKDRLVTERKDEVDGGAELSSNKTDKDNGKKSTATKSNHEDESEAKSDAKDSQDESEYLDAESFSPPDIFKIVVEDNNQNEGKTVKDDGNKKMKSVVNMNDDRLTVSQDSCDSVYYDVEDEFEVKTVLRSGRKIRKETNLGIPQLEKSHMNSDVNRFDSNTKSSEQDSKDKNNKQIVDEDLQTFSSGKFVDTVVKCNTNNNTYVRNESSQISENAETQPPEAEICSNEVTSSGQLIEIVEDSENRNTLEESDAESDSFDEMLKGFIENKKATVINVEIADRSKKGNDDNYVMVTKKTPGKLNNKQSGKRKRENDKDETDCSREEKKRKLVEECRANIKTISNKYGLSEGFVRQLLYQCSSDINRLISYIEYGPHSLELPPWTDIDDEILEKDPKAVRLINKFGEKDVTTRYNFLNYIT